MSSRLVVSWKKKNAFVNYWNFPGKGIKGTQLEIASPKLTREILKQGVKYV